MSVQFILCFTFQAERKEKRNELLHFLNSLSEVTAYFVFHLKFHVVSSLLSVLKIEILMHKSIEVPVALPLKMSFSQKRK